MPGYLTAAVLVWSASMLGVLGYMVYGGANGKTTDQMLLPGAVILVVGGVIGWVLLWYGRKQRRKVTPEWLSTQAIRSDLVKKHARRAETPAGGVPLNKDDES